MKTRPVLLTMDYSAMELRVAQQIGASMRGVVHYGVMMPGGEQVTTDQGKTHTIKRFESLCGLSSGADVEMDLEDYTASERAGVLTCPHCDVLISVAQANGIDMKREGQRKRIERFLEKQK